MSPLGTVQDVLVGNFMSCAQPHSLQYRFLPQFAAYTSLPEDTPGGFLDMVGLLDCSSGKLGEDSLVPGFGFTY